MGPVLSQVNDIGVQPYLAGSFTQSEAFEAGSAPLKDFMLDHTRGEDLALITRAADRAQPDQPGGDADAHADPGVRALRAARRRSSSASSSSCPFLVIDIVVAAALMSMGMMMLPPVTVSLPFKLLLFVLVDGWGLVITSVVGSYG